jgi:LPS export ABC transporter permease LptG
VLVTFGALSRSSEITAMKATGVSLYRIVTPVLLVAAILSALLFAFDESYLPAANRRQEALLSSIKGKPAQTFLRPDRKWISGQNGASESAEPTRIFYYQAFDADRNVFANISVFEFEPGSFTLSRRMYAESAHWDAAARHWDFENGWERAFANGDAVTSYRAFQQASFAEIHETPIYFKKEERPSQEMSYSELSAYIRDLQQSGFDTTPLRVQLNRKLSYPLLTLVMAILAVPFSLSVGKRGNLAGIGAAVALAILWYVLAGISENLGNVNSLPAVLAAWSPDVLFAMAGSYLLLRTPT